MSRIAVTSAVAILATSLASCSVDLTELSESAPPVNECSDDSDCGAGVCTRDTCVAREGELGTVLFEVTPPVGAIGVGSVRFLQTVTGLSESGFDLELDLRRLTRVRGFVGGGDPERQGGCLVNETLPVQVTLTPRQQILGLPVSTHVTRTTLTQPDLDRHPCSEKLDPGETVYEFAFEIPAGDYDVYVEAIPDESVGAPAQDGECEIIPHLLRNVTIAAGEVCLPVTPGAPQELTIDVIWPAGSAGVQTLDGWTVDMIHPVTGQLLSSRERLEGPPMGTTSNGESAYTESLRFSLVAGEDYVDPQQELVRLTPPEGVEGPVLHWVRFALAPFGEAVVGNLEPFPAPIEVESWLWEERGIEQDREIGVPGNVTLRATELEGVGDGVFASFSKTVEVGEDGRLTALLLPGVYLLRAEPAIGSGLALTETTIEIQCDRSAGDPDPCPAGVPGQAPSRRVIGSVEIPDAATLSGVTRLPVGGQRPVGAAAHAVPASFRARRCEGLDGDCAQQRINVLEASLGEEAFVPRAATALVREDGRFLFDELDCGACEPNNGAEFNVSIRPAEGTGFPWYVKQGLTVATERDVGQVLVPLPVVHEGVVQIPQVDAEAVLVPGALIRAYIYRDNEGRYVAEPEGLPSCAQQTTGRCLRSVLQIAEARASSEGTFRLLLPARIE